MRLNETQMAEVALDFIKNNFTLSDKPVVGSSFITPEGKFVDLKSAGYEHIDLLKALEKVGVKSTDDEAIPGVQSNGWIRCNNGLGKYSYIEFGEVVPTTEQWDAAEEWLDSVLEKSKKVTVIYMTFDTYEEEDYGQMVMGRQIVKAVKRAYSTGRLIKSSAFESISGRPKMSKEEINRRRKEIHNMANHRDFSSINVHWDSPDDGYGNKMSGFYALDGGYVGNEDFCKKLMDMGIVPELIKAGDKTCSVGFCEKEQKWYGWTHRGMHGFGIGHICKKGDSGVLDKPSDRIKAPIPWPTAGFKVKTLGDARMVAAAFADSLD